MFGQRRPIIGVLNNFHFKPLKTKIEPLVMYQEPGGIMVIRVNPGNIKTTQAALEESYSEIVPEIPFEYGFVDEDYDNMYRLTKYWASFYMGEDKNRYYGYDSIGNMTSMRTAITMPTTHQYEDSIHPHQLTRYIRGQDRQLSLEYDENGEIITKGEYFDGEKEGEWFYEVGDHSEIGSYVIGLRDGKWKYFYDPLFDGCVGNRYEKTGPRQGLQYREKDLP